MNIFKHRKNLKPYEYPFLQEFVDAIRHSYWIHTEFNFTSDIQDFKVNITEEEREIIKRTMLAIAQIEVSVKTFWWDIYKHIPKPEIGSVWFTFAESEVRHQDAYSHLLEILWLNDEFKKLENVECISWRINYLEKVLENKNKQWVDYAQTVLLFSLFIEHVSLFSQFYIMMAFNKHKNLFKWISNVVEATSKEEQIHWMFWIDIINIIKAENPSWFTKELEEEIKKLCLEAFGVEMDILNWIFEKWTTDIIDKKEVEHFLMNRFNNSLWSIWIKNKLFCIDQFLVEKTEWFDEEIFITKHIDFFNKRSINYNKWAQSVTSDDLF